MLSKINIIKNKLVIKPFKNSHPVVLFAYFLSVITLTIIQQNYYLIILSIVSAIIIDYYFNYLTFFKDMKYTVVLVVIIMITNPLFVTEGFDIWFQNDYVTITKQALFYGLVFGLLLSCMLLWFRIMKTCLTDSHIVYLFGSILPTLGLVISMCLNMISKLKNQYQKIREANINMPSQNKLDYYRNMIVVLVTYAFESSLDMMNSMQARGYGQGKRTSFHLYSFRKDDALKLIVIIGLFMISLLGFLIRYRSFYYFPLIQEFSLQWQDGLFMLVYIGLMLLPIYLGGKKNV